MHFGSNSISAHRRDEKIDCRSSGEARIHQPLFNLDEKGNRSQHSVIQAFGHQRKIHREFSDIRTLRAITCCRVTCSQFGPAHRAMSFAALAAARTEKEFHQFAEMMLTILTSKKLCK